MKALTSIFSRFSDRTPGCAVAVVQNGKTVSECYTGKEQIPYGPDISRSTAFRLASISKLFTALGIIILKHNNMLNYSDTLRSFFPALPKFTDTITISQLLTHTSGLPDHEKPLYRLLNSSTYPHIQDALIVLGRKRTSIFIPGSSFKYSDAAYVMLAHILEVCSKYTYSQFIERYICKPLCMSNTFVFDNTNKTIPGRAFGYLKRSGSYTLFDDDPLNFIVGDEGIYSTIPDMIMFLRAWDSDILIPKREIFRSITPASIGDGMTGRCGFAWFTDGATYAFQDGIWVGFTGIIYRDLLAKRTVILLSNTRDYSSEMVRVSIAKKILALSFK